MSKKVDPVPDTIAEALKDEVDALADENAATTDSELRYAAYGARLRTALRAGTRYVAYVGPTFVSGKFHQIPSRPVTSVKPSGLSCRLGSSPPRTVSRGSISAET